MPNIQYSLVSSQEDSFLTASIDGEIHPAGQSHPNYTEILDLLQRACDKGEEIDVQRLIDLFDLSEAVAKRFKKLSERVAVSNGTITLDGDPVDGSLQEQILQFMEAGEDFRPLVEFYEKLLTNPLGDVRAGLYDYINGQRRGGNFTITPDGDILGYKSMQSSTPEWRTDEETVYVPSRRGEGIVNGREVTSEEYIEQVPGDVVEMPRSRVLYAPSQACGDGLHIGTYQYASTFSGDTVMLVRFSPRDIVSMPDRNSEWKLRVCRYTVVEQVNAPLDVPVYSPQGSDDPVCTDLGDEGGHGPQTQSEDLSIKIGDRVRDDDGDKGTVVGFDSGGDPVIRYDDEVYGTLAIPFDGVQVIEEERRFRVGDYVEDGDGDRGTVVRFDRHDDPVIEYDDEDYGVEDWPEDDVTLIARPDLDVSL